MEQPQRKLFPPKALDVLTQFDATAEATKFVAADGPLEKDIRAFLVSVAAALKQDCKIHDWKQDFPENEDGYIYVRLFPQAWELAKVGPVAFCVGWCHPFSAGAEDLAVEVRIPWNWSRADELRQLLLSQIPDGFTNVYDGDADADYPFWRYIRFQDFISSSGLDTNAFYLEILSAFRRLLSLQPHIDDYISRGDVLEIRTARRGLGMMAVVDTETAGAEQELIELAVINAVYDKGTGEVLGILEQYEGLREPKCRILRADQRLNGLGIDEVRGRYLDEERIKSMLKRADFIVAHNSPFDKARLTEQFKWAAELDWRDSLTGVHWETKTRDLPSLLQCHGVDCESSHRAGSDARALLELLSYNGGAYLRQILSLKRDAVCV